MRHSYEIEIKSLLGNKENAESLVEKMKAKDPSFKVIGTHKQLNHYFVEGDLSKLYANLETSIPNIKKEQLKKIIAEAKDFSVRTRWADDKVIFVMKASVDDTTSSNGTARMEFETEVNMSLEELDKILLDSGFKYQAKWSREREEYKFNDLNVSVDKNAGYGYLAEFEAVIDDSGNADVTKTFIRNVMNELGVDELPQDRLERMFKHYNENWEQYYGTDKVFNIE